MLKERDDLYQRAVIVKDTSTWEQFKKKRSAVVGQTRIEKEIYFIGVIDENKNNPKELWKNLKTLLPDEILFDDLTLDNDLNIANRFNEFFIDSISELVRSLPKKTIRLVN